MKHTRITSLLALVLVAVMMLTLVGCGDKQEDSGKPTASKKTTVTTTTTTTGNGEGTPTDTTGGDTITDTTGGDTTGSDTTGSDTTASDTTTGTTTGTVVDDPFKTTGTTTGTKKPTTTTTTTAKDIPVGDESILSKVPSKLSGVKIKMLVWWDVGQTDLDETAAFKKETGIQVTVETATQEKYQTHLSSKLMAGNFPHIAAICNDWFPQPITRGLMQPIKNTGWDYTNKTDDIYALGMMDQFTYKGDYYGVTLKGSNMPTYAVMFFNKDIMDAKGIQKDPYELWKSGQWNWDTFLSIAKACTDAKKNQYGLTLYSNYFWMLSAGQDFVLSSPKGLTNNIKNPDLLDAWNFAWDVTNTHKVKIPLTNDQSSAFYDESAAMLGAGSFFMQADPMRTTYVPQSCKFNWGVVPFPSPAGQSFISACEGTVWGFPSKVKGDQLQAAMWYLRYYLDDANYGERDFYPKEECWEVMAWMSAQKTQCYNSLGVITYGGKHNAWTIGYTLITEATTKAQVKTNLDAWYSELENNIKTIESELV